MLKAVNLFAAAAALLPSSFVRAGDIPVPAQLRGRYRGNVYQQFGLADLKNPQSFECIRDENAKQGSMSASNVEAELKENSGSLGGYKASTKEINNAEYGMAAREPFAFEWADWSGTSSSGGVVKMRTKDGKIVCKYAKYSGGKLMYVTLGGSAFTWEDQCNLAAYKAIPDFETKAYCLPVSADNRAPLKSTTLEIYSGKTGGLSGATGNAVALVTAAMAAGVAVALAQ